MIYPCFRSQVGCLLYTIVTIRYPYGVGSEVYDRMRQPLDMGAFDAFPQFQDFVRGLMALDPQRRPTAMEALSHPWLLEPQNRYEQRSVGLFS